MTGEGRGRIYDDADEVQFLEFIVFPSLREAILFFFVVGVEQAVNWAVCRAGAEEGGHLEQSITHSFV